MPKTKKAETFDAFKGTIVTVTREPSGLEGQEEKERFHLEIEPLNVEIKGKTGKMHEWYPISDKTTETEFMENSVLDNLAKELNILVDGFEKTELINDAFKLLEGKSFLFRKIRLGRSFEGKEAKEYWTPKQLLNDEEIKKAKEEKEKK